MQLGQDVTSTDIGTTTSFVDYTSPASPMAPVTADTSAMDAATTSAVSSNTDFMGNLNLTGLVNSVAASYVAVQKAVNAGTAPPGTALHPMPGTVTQLPGGGTSVVNADGSTTITDASGNKRTILVGGQVVNGGAPIIGSIPNSTLLIAGIGIVGLLMRMGGR